MPQIKVPRTETEVPLQLLLTAGGGPVTGGTVVVGIRDGDTGNSWLDWNDMTFKAAGWTTRQASCTESTIQDGEYVLAAGLDLTAITNLPAATTHLVAVFEATAPASAAGVAEDLILIDAIGPTLDVVSGDLATHDAALTAHDGTLDVVSADVAVLDTSGIAGVQTTLDVVSGDLAAHDAALTAHDTVLDAVSGDLAAHDVVLDAVAGDVERLYGRNNRTRLHYATALISGATRIVPSGAVSHMETQVKTDLAADWSAPTTFYVWFNYTATATAADPPASAEPATAAPADGSFLAEDYPA